MTRTDAIALVDAGAMPLSRYVEMVVADEFEAPPPGSTRNPASGNCGSDEPPFLSEQQQDDHGTHHAAAVLLPCAPDGASERGR